MFSEKPGPSITTMPRTGQALMSWMVAGIFSSAVPVVPWYLHSRPNFRRERGSVTTTVAAMVVGETIAPALVGVIWLGDTARDGLGWVVIAGFVVAVSATLMLARFGEAPTPAESN